MDAKKFIRDFSKALTLKQWLFVLAFFILIYPFVSFLSNPYEKRMCLNDNRFLGCFSGYLKYHAYKLTGNCYITKFDEKGEPVERHDLLLDIYVVNSKNFTDEEIVKVLDEANLIWKDYGIQFHINTLTRIENYSSTPIPTKTLEDIENFAKGVVKDRLYYDEDKIIDIIFIEKFWKKIELKIPIFDIIIWTHYSDAGTEGRGLKSFDNRSVNLVLISTKSKNVSWSLAHEVGHVLGNLDKAYYSGEYNLMTHGGCIKNRYYPTLLNQHQVDSAVSMARSLEHKDQNI